MEITNKLTEEIKTKENISELFNTDYVKVEERRPWSKSEIKKLIRDELQNVKTY